MPSHGKTTMHGGWSSTSSINHFEQGYLYSTSVMVKLHDMCGPWSSQHCLEPEIVGDRNSLLMVV